MFHDLANALGVAQIRLLELTEDGPAGSARRASLDAIGDAIGDSVAVARELRALVDGLFAARAGGRQGAKRTGSS